VPEKERHGEILKYVKFNRRCTKAEVIRYMNYKAMGSTVTIHKDIINLIREKKLLVLKNKLNSQTHHLTLNNKNYYNLINEQLLEIETHVGEMNEPMLNLRKLRNKELKANLNSLFVSNYIKTLGIILDNLLVKIHQTIHSENESQFFYSRIAKLNLKLKLQEKHNISHETRQLAEKTWSMSLRLNIISPKLKERANRHGINTELHDKTMKIYNDYLKRFPR
jgi:hypothetical protein